MKKVLILLLVILYFASPIDAMPGCPLDDIAVVILGVMAMTNNSLPDSGNN